MGSGAYFDEVASQWDAMREEYFSTAVRERAFAVAGVQAGQLAADIGAGTGFLTEGLIQQGVRVIAVDQSAAMLEELQRKFAGMGEIDCRVGDAANLPIADGAVDYVLANMYLHHVEFPSEAIREMVRVLKPAGKLVITDLDEHEFEFLRTEQHDRWLGFAREIRRWFMEAGLNSVDVDCVNQNCCADSECGDGAASISIFVASGEKDS